ncbi:hypothetical protein GCM10010519_17720 [Streptomyces lactacystinicus]
MMVESVIGTPLHVSNVLTSRYLVTGLRLHLPPFPVAFRSRSGPARVRSAGAAALAAGRSGSRERGSAQDSTQGAAQDVPGAELHGGPGRHARQAERSTGGLVHSGESDVRSASTHDPIRSTARQDRRSPGRAALASRQ